jgi:thiol-disulfide isomerase/thioredoxin
MKSFLFLLAGIFLITLTACQSDKSTPQPTKQAPDFSLTSLSGQTVRLSEMRGKVVLLNFWATWCPPCREEVPSLARLANAMSNSEFQMITVAIDKEGRKAVDEFFRHAGVQLPTLIDSTGVVGKSYGITGVPETFIIDKQGLINKKVIGPIDWSQPDTIKYLQELANR